MQNRDLIVVATQLGEVLKKQGGCMATVESCTGGGIGYTVTSLDGSSAWFDRAFVTYSNIAKQQLVDVAEELIDRHGAVSEEVAMAMVTGGLANSVADYCVAVTGVAGPGGGSADKPVGTVCFAWARQLTNEKQIFSVVTKLFQGDRHEVRKAAIHEALQGLLRLSD